MLELYVYYRVPAGTTSAQPEIEALHTRLVAELPGLEARLLQRADGQHSAPDQLTWMEIYRHPQGLSPEQLQHIIHASAGWPSARIGTRHLEHFTTAVR